MREIKFRALREKYTPEWHESKWYYGNLLNENSMGVVGWDLTEYTFTKIIPESVGQFTGLKDKNGTEIYEGDIVKTSHYLGNCVIEFWVPYHSFVLAKGNLCVSDKYDWSDVDVIGNIYENPDLLKN